MYNVYIWKVSPYFAKVSCLFMKYLIWSPYENELNGFLTLVMLSPYLQQKYSKCIIPSENVVASVASSENVDNYTLGLRFLRGITIKDFLYQTISFDIYSENFKGINSTIMKGSIKELSTNYWLIDWLMSYRWHLSHLTAELNIFMNVRILIYLSIQFYIKYFHSYSCA